MIEVLRKQNKYGESALTQVLGGGYSQTISTRTQKARAGASQEDYILSLPLLGASLTLDYSHSVQLTPNRSKIVWKETYQGSIEIGKEKITIDHVNESGKELKKGFDIERFVYAVSAYSYVLKNINSVILKGKTLEDLNKMPIEELEKLSSKKDEIVSSFKKAMLKTSIQEDCSDLNSQKMIDELFGEGNVNLNEIIRENVDKELQIRERATEKRFAKAELDETRVKEIAAIKEGFTKLVTPVKMIYVKVINFFRNKYLERAQKNEIKAEKIKRDELIESLSM